MFEYISTHFEWQDSKYEMIEEFKGEIINDDDVSLPTMEDMYHNSLAPLIDIKDVDEDMAFYLEDPPGGEKIVGFYNDMFVIKTGPGYTLKGKDGQEIKSAFSVPGLSIYNGMNSASTLSFSTPYCDVGENAENISYLQQLTDQKALFAYLTGKYNQKVYNLNDLKVRLLFVDIPKTPKYSTEWLEKHKIKKMKYGEARTNTNIHLQPFQAEFDDNNGTLSVDIEPSLREYTDDDDIYIYDNIVQVWPYEGSIIENQTNPKLDDENVGYLKEKYTDALVREITDADYKRAGIKPLDLADYDCSKTFKQFPQFDSFGRCKGSAVGCLGLETLPDPDATRVPLQPAKPSGWHNYFFECIEEVLVEDKEDDSDDSTDKKKRALYNRCHLLRYGLTGENINARNLITGTDAMNKIGMLKYEDMALDFVSKTNPGEHILYRVTPDFYNNNLVAHGVLMECIAVEQKKKLFSVYVPNLQQNVAINYINGTAWEVKEGLPDIRPNITLQKFYVLNNNEAQLETINFSYRLRNFVINTIFKAKDSRVVIPTGAQSRRKDYKAPYSLDFLEPKSPLADAIKKAYTDDSIDKDSEWYKYSGFNMYGLDTYSRALGVVYLKLDIKGQERWVNFNKYIISYVHSSDVVKNSDFIPDETNFLDYFDTDRAIMDGWSYDIENINYQDNFWKQLETRYGQDERRRKLQMQAFKAAGLHIDMSEKCLRDWTVSIGDVTFFCPPAAITTTTQTMTERMPLLRAKGSMAKNIEKSDTQLELALFFNNDYGINGQPITVPIWENKDKDVSPNKKPYSDEQATYYMNGLRALIAEFKFTPFLPIVNTYINETLEIAAVSLEELSIETVPGFPRLLKAKLRLKNFDYRIYMPQVPFLVMEENEKGEKIPDNPFAQCVNYDVMRYYYQKPLLLGNKLAEKLNKQDESFYSFNSKEFLRDTLMSNKTALMPCHFTNNKINIYIASENYLAKLMDIKQKAIQRATVGATDNFVANKAEQRYCSDIKAIWLDSDVGKIFEYYQKVRAEIFEAYKQTFFPANKKFNYTFKTYKESITSEAKGIELKYDLIDTTLLSDIVYKYICENFFKEVENAIKTHKPTNVDGEEVVQHVYIDFYDKKSTKIEINMKYLQDPSDIKILVDQFKKERKIEDDTFEIKDLIALRLYNLPAKILSSDINEPIDLSLRDDAYITAQFLSWCSTLPINQVDSNEEAQEKKDSMDWEDVKSIEFDLVGEDIRIDSFQAAMANNFARISLNDSDGYVSQYMGSSDIHISWSFTTKDKDVASLMKKLPEYEAYCMRKYHIVLPCFPIRIESEFTKMLGVFEVSIEDVSVNTKEGYPGVYVVSVRSISVDRTLRNREALRQLDNKIDKQTNNNANGQSGEIDNSGLILSGANAAKRIKTFADLDNKLAQAELYPDLELPKIGELGEKGFIFIRYKDKARDRNDLFVDPDFYFYYPFSTAAEAIRATIQANFPKDPDKKEQTEIYSENNGTTIKNIDTVSNMNITYSDNSGYGGANFNTRDNKVTLDDSNDEYAQEVKSVRAQRNATAEHLANFEDLKLIEAFPIGFIGDTGKWDISTKIMTCFSESFFLDLKKLEEKSEKVKDSDSKESKESDKEKTKKSKETSKEPEKKEEAKDDKKEADDSKDKEKSEKKKAQLLKFNEFYKENFKQTDMNNNLGKLYSYLKTTPIPVSGYADKLVTKLNTMIGDSSFEEIFKNTKHLLKDIYINIDDIKKQEDFFTTHSVLGDFGSALWAMYTGKFEYNSTLEDHYWQGRYDIGAFGTKRDKDNVITKADKDTPLAEMESYGAFEIKCYKYSKIIEFLDGDEREEFNKYYNNIKPETVKNGKENMRFVLDPYYRYHPEAVDEYLQRCKLDIEFCVKAYSRIVVWWIYKLYKAELFPNFCYDVMRQKNITIGSATLRAKQLVEEQYKQSVYIDTKLIDEAAKFIEKNSGAIDMGKIFTAVVMAIYDVPIKDNNLFPLMMKRDYSALNSKIRQIMSKTTEDKGKIDTKEAMLRKFLLALCGFKIINAPSYVGRSTDVTPASRFVENHNIKIALEAAANPTTYLFHSFYDMIRNDYRGRMLRAFPTFYTVFMDEGKEIGLWKLHDNFYSINNIIDVTITKSRKIPADTCIFTISNNYSTFTTDDEDGYINYRGATFSDLYDSIFHEKKIALEAEKRRAAATKINKAKLQPGIRIHVREGYGSDARELAGVFNGVIAEVIPKGNAVSIVAQGNGIELANPLMEDRDADEVQFKDLAGDAVNNIEGGGASPRKIITSFLTTHNGALRTYMMGQYNENQWFYRTGVADTEDESFGPMGLFEQWVADVWKGNAYGVVHFGEPFYKDIFPEGEIVQNIYEVSALPNMDQGGAQLYDDSKDQQEPPFISFEPRGKTMWDVLHICKSVAPDFVTGIASFGFRDTIFFGKPHYYYAYQYQKVNDVYVEKRKPFSQYHILLSDNDIISNTITASAKKMCNVATGLYKDKMGWIEKNKDVGPMWVDKNIYPESQKSMIVDTRLKLKDNNPLLNRMDQNDMTAGGGGNFVCDTLVYGFQSFAQSLLNSPFFGWIGTGVSYVAEEYLGGMFDETGQWSSHKKIAWSSTANALKDSVKEMYQGDITIIGSPSIKPNDRLIISDRYNDMNGSVLVRDVVHTLSSTTGFTSMMHVDAISAVDEKDEMKIQSMTGFIVANIIQSISFGVLLNWKVSSGVKIINKGLASFGEKIKESIDFGESSKIESLKNLGKTTCGRMKDLIKISEEAGGKTRMMAKAGRIFKMIISGAGIVTALAIGGPMTLLMALAAFAARYILETIIVEGILGSISEAILFSIKNQRVLQIFPLKKNGMVYTAGLEGNIGSVYGSPTYGQCGPMEEIQKTLFASTEDGGSDNAIIQMFRSLLVSPEAQAEAAKYSRDLSYATRIGNNPKGDEMALQSVSIGIMKNPAFTVRRSDVFSLTLDPRINIRRKDTKTFMALKNALNKYRIENVQDVLQDSTKRNQIRIYNYQPIAPLIKSGFVKVIHEEKGIDQKLNCVQYTALISGKEETVYGIKINAGVVDLPFLSKDAIIVLNAICKKAFLKMIHEEPDNLKDENSIQQVIKGTHITIVSALRVGEENGFTSSGYSFAIKGTGKMDNGELNKIAQEIIDETNKKIQMINGKDTTIKAPFEISNKSTNKELRINISPKSPMAEYIEKTEANKTQQKQDKDKQEQDKTK